MTKVSKALLKALDRLEPIAPQWARMFRKMGVEAHMLWKFQTKGKWYDLGIDAYCIVGEAHGRKGYYMSIYEKPQACMICGLLAGDFVEQRPIINSELAKLINKFVNHWNKEHKKKK